LRKLIAHHYQDHDQSDSAEYGPIGLEKAAREWHLRLNEGTTVIRSHVFIHSNEEEKSTDTKVGEMAMNQ
jgi:hypothetical protein